MPKKTVGSGMMDDGDKDRQLEPIVFQGCEIRRVYIPEWNDWGAVGIDVAAAVGYRRPRNALTNILDRNKADFVGESTATRLGAVDGKERPHTILSRKGMKKFGMLADTPKAVAFRDWVAQFLTDIEDGKLSVGPGLNADTQMLAERVQARQEVSQLTKAAHRAIAIAGGIKWHHINFERWLSKAIHNQMPKQVKERHCIDKKRATADFEPVSALSLRTMTCSILVARCESGQLMQDDLMPQLREVPEEVAKFYEKMTHCKPGSHALEQDIRPLVLESQKKKRLPQPDNQMRLFAK